MRRIDWPYFASWAALLAVCGVVYGSLLYSLAYADDPPPSTTLQSCRGPLPSLSLRDNAQDGCVSFDVGATDPDDPDHLAKGGKNTYRHVYFVSGDAACVGTLDKGGRLDSGRDCSADDEPSGQCAFIAQGYELFAVTDGSCSQHGVTPCEGFFCK